MQVILSKGGTTTGGARDAAEVVVISARRAELLARSASNSSLPAVLDSIRAQCAVILWDEAGSGANPIPATT